MAIIDMTKMYYMHNELSMQLRRGVTRHYLLATRQSLLCSPLASMEKAIKNIILAVETLYIHTFRRLP